MGYRKMGNNPEVFGMIGDWYSDTMDSCGS